MAIPAGEPLLSSIEQLSTAVSHIRSDNYAILAAQVIIIFDWLLTLDLEVSLIWSSPRSIVNVLFISVRLWPFLVMGITEAHEFSYSLSGRTCSVLYNVLAASYFTSAFLSELLLTLRTWAILGRGKQLAYSLFGFFSVTWVLIIVTQGLYLKNSIHLASPAPPLVGCIVMGGMSYLITCFTLLLVYDAVALSLMVAQGIKTFRFNTSSRLSWVAHRDGIVYYAYLFGLSLTNVIIMISLPEDYILFLAFLEVTIHSVLACRVVLHIREQAYLLPREIRLT